MAKKTAQSWPRLVDMLRDSICDVPLGNLLLCLYSIGFDLNSCNKYNKSRKILSGVSWIYPDLVRHLQSPRHVSEIVLVSKKVVEVIEANGRQESDVLGYVGDALLELNIAYINAVGCDCGERIELVFGENHKSHKMVKKWFGRHLLNHDAKDRAFMALCGKINAGLIRSWLDIISVDLAITDILAVNVV